MTRERRAKHHVLSIYPVPSVSSELSHRGQKVGRLSLHQRIGKKKLQLKVRGISSGVVISRNDFRERDVLFGGEPVPNRLESGNQFHRVLKILLFGVW